MESTINQQFLNKNFCFTQDLQSRLQQQQPTVDNLGQALYNLKSVTQKCRPGVARYYDIEAAEKEAADLGQRFDNICIQVVER